MTPAWSSLTRRVNDGIIVLTTRGAVAACGLLLLVAVSCGGSTSVNLSTEYEVARAKGELADRSFRQFDPHIDGSPRKGVVLDFFGPLSLWAQYAEGGHTLNEWEIIADDYRVDRTATAQEVRLFPISPRTRQTLPSECENCIDVTGVTIAVRNVQDPEKISFRIEDPHGVLPRPFPVFDKWTRFQEDEVQN
ncbi:MAG: hypothetical protein OXF79_00250 [Chloroflexi bacterium]|nr:hypothetical protein [Chloroflexota bacterium]